jgi:hypothetical protein
MPLAVLFSVSPTEFEPGRSVRLNATIIDPFTNQRVTGGYTITVEFFNYSSDPPASMSLGRFDTTIGMVVRNVTYPDNNRAHAYMAKVVPAYAGTNLTQGVGSSPVQLTVSKSTRLLLNVTRDSETSDHVIHGWLLDKASVGIGQKLIKLRVNETEYTLETTYGGYAIGLNLQAVNNKATTYVITTRFEGDQPLNSTAWANTLDGQRYAACTTIQYGYKPSANSTILIVEPQATEATVQTKTSEEAQKEAEDNGWLETWSGPGDSWWTWWKFYIRVHIDWLNFTAQAWMGFPGGVGLDEFSGLENIFFNAYKDVADDTISVTQSAVINAITTVTAAFVTGGLATLAASVTAWPAYWILLAAYSISMSVAITAIYLTMEKSLATSILSAVGGALIGFVLSLYVLDFVSLWWTSASLSYTMGSALQIAAAKATVNYFGSFAIKQIACLVGFASWINVEFNIVTAVLGLLALGLASWEG